MHLSGLFIYPVKSLRGLAVESAEVDVLGLVGDRRFLVVDDRGLFLTQRTLPRMAGIATALTAGELVLTAEAHGSISVPLRTREPAPLRTVEVWRSKNLLAEDCGPDASQWLSAFLGVACHLVRIGERFRRPVLERPPFTSAPAGAPTIDGRVVSADLFHFADGFPFLVATEASLADLNARLAALGAPAAGMDRFRPNLVVAGGAAFAEDAWSHLRIGDIGFRSGGPCARCIVTTTDQHTGERLGPEPLRTLAAYRRDPDDPSRLNFGLNLVHETKTGTLNVGDIVDVL